MASKIMRVLVLGALPSALWGGMASSAVAQSEGWNVGPGGPTETASQPEPLGASPTQPLGGYRVGPGQGTGSYTMDPARSPYGMPYGQRPGSYGSPIGQESQGLGPGFGSPPFAAWPGGQQSETIGAPGTMGGPGMMGAPSSMGGPSSMRGPAMMGGPGSMGRPGSMGGPGLSSVPGMMGGPRRMAGPSMMGNQDIMGIIWNLDLTEEQREKLGSIADDLRKKRWELTGQIMEKHNEIRRLYNEQMRHNQTISELRAQIMDAGMGANNQAKDVLTDEQRKQLEEMQGPMMFP